MTVWEAEFFLQHDALSNARLGRAMFQPKIFVRKDSA
jgi:hypothetical protein